MINIIIKIHTHVSFAGGSSIGSPGGISSGSWFINRLILQNQNIYI